MCLTTENPRFEELRCGESEPLKRRLPVGGSGQVRDGFSLGALDPTFLEAELLAPSFPTSISRHSGIYHWEVQDHFQNH